MVCKQVPAPRPAAGDPAALCAATLCIKRRSESPPGTPFVPRKRRTAAAGAHNQHAAAAASGPVAAGAAQTAPAQAPAPPASGSLDGGEATQSFLRAQPPTPSKAKSGDLPDAWAARRKASSSAAGGSSEVGSVHLPHLTVRSARAAELPASARSEGRALSGMRGVH